MASIAVGQEQVSLPLEGYYRAGRYMPLRVTIPAGEASRETGLVLRAAGALTTEVDAAAGGDVVVPLLPLAEPMRDLTWARGDGTPAPTNLALRPLGDAQRLVGIAGVLEGEAKEVLARPGETIIPVALDPVSPLPGPAAAWETLDGLVLDEASAARVRTSQLQIILAAGTIVAVRAEQKPAGEWPWQREGNFWVLRPRILGPRSAVVPAAYVPIHGWGDGATPVFRRTLAGLLVVFVIAATAAALWRSAYAVVGVVVIVILTTVGLLFWHARQPSAHSLSAPVSISGGKIAQEDEWTYRRTIGAAEVSIALPAPGLSKPVFFKISHAREVDARLRCDAAGLPTHLIASLGPDMTLAALTRSVAPASNVSTIPSNAPKSSSPMAIASDELYQFRIRETSFPPDYASAERWPTLYLQRPLERRPTGR